MTWDWAGFTSTSRSSQAGAVCGTTSLFDVMKEDEACVERYLQARGLRCSRFSKGEMKQSKTPDFRVWSNGDMVFYCEVKSSLEDTWLDRQFEKIKAGFIAGGLRNDPIFNRLTSDIHQAAKQLDAINPAREFSNVLAIVNHDSNCGFLDLLGVVTGNFYADDGSVHPIYRQFSEGRIRGRKDLIDLYIWIDDFKPDRQLFTSTDGSSTARLCNALGVDPADIKKIEQ